MDTPFPDSQDADGSIPPSGNGNDATDVDSQSGIGDPEAFSPIDPSSLPPELQGLWKGLQADYTKKSMELSNLRKDLEGKQTELQKFMNDPRYRKAMNAAIEAVEQEEQGGGPAAFTLPDPFGGKDYTEQFSTPEAVTAIQQQAWKTIEKHFLPLLTPYIRVVEQLHSQMGDQEWNQTVQQYPAAKDFEREVKALRQRTGLSYKQALFAVAGEKLQAPAKAPAGQSQKGTPPTSPADKLGAQAVRTRPAAQGGHPDSRKLSIRDLFMESV